MHVHVAFAHTLREKTRARVPAICKQIHQLSDFSERDLWAVGIGILWCARGSWHGDGREVTGCALLYVYLVGPRTLVLLEPKSTS